MVPGGLTLVACLGALLLSLGARVQADDVIHKVVGSDVTLVPKFTGSPSEINWKVDGNKLVEMELSPYRRKFYRLEDRATINDKDGRLTITKLVIGDTGQYKAEVLVNNNINYTTINLIVLECPSLPTVKYRIVAENTLELDCENSTGNVKYEWKQGATHLSDHQLFNVSRTNELVYMTCVVSNDACERNVTVPIHPVYSNNWKRIGGILGGVGVSFLIIICVLSYCLHKYIYKCKGLKKVQQEEEGAAFFRGPLQNQLIAHEVQQEEEEGAAFIRGPLQNQLIAQEPTKDQAVPSTENKVTSNTNNREVTDSTKSKKSLPENEPTKDQAVPSTENKVTSNTNNREEGDSFITKNDRILIGPAGDLNVQPEDKGIHSENQEFVLELTLNKA